MSVTSSSAKVKFFIGSFDYGTTLTLPDTTLENKLTLEIEELISPQLAQWGDVPLPIYALFKVDFNGTEVYKNTDYDSPSTSVAPTDPDITITPDADPATEETIVINNYVSMVTDTDGAISEGTYVVTVKFVYWAADTAFGSEIGTFTAALEWENKEPTLSEWYDQGTPKLNVTDGQSYVLNGTTADRDTEFVLSPPQNRAEVTNTFDNIQSVNYTNFWTGGNEITYTVLLTYTFTDYIIVNAQQAYKSFTIYYVDNCTIYECLKDQYDLWKSATCGTKVAATAKDTLYEATSIALQITQGTGCNSDELSSLIEDFNELLECDCGCLDSTPRQLGSASTVLATDRQSVTASTATTAIDLSAGSTITVSVSANTELDVSNIEQYTNYRFIFISSTGGEEITFASGKFQDNDGQLQPVVLNDSGVLIMDFYAETLSILTLLSRSDADDYDRDLQEVSATTAETSVDLTQGNIINVSLAVAGGTTEISVTNIKENDEYVFIFRRSFASQEVTFSSDFNGSNGTVPPATPLLDDKVVLSFIATSPTELTLMSRSDDTSDFVESVVGTSQEIDVDATDSANPVISLASEVTASLSLADSALQNYTEQSVSATTATTPIDLALGNMVNVSLETATTELSVENIVSGESYLFTFVTDSSNQTITFDSSFLSAQPSFPPVTPVSSRKTSLLFRATSGTTLLLISRSDNGRVDAVDEGVGINVDLSDPTEPIISLDSNSVASLALADTAIQSLDYSVSDEGNQNGNTSFSVDFSLATQMYTLDMNFVDLTITSASTVPIENGRTYVFMVRNTSGGVRTLTFSSFAFINADLAVANIVKNIADGESGVFTFIGNTGFLGSNKLILASENI